MTNVEAQSKLESLGIDTVGMSFNKSISKKVYATVKRGDGCYIMRQVSFERGKSWGEKLWSLPLTAEERATILHTC